MKIKKVKPGEKGQDLRPGEEGAAAEDSGERLPARPPAVLKNGPPTRGALTPSRHFSVTTFHNDWDAEWSRVLAIVARTR